VAERVEVTRQMFAWARTRARLEVDDLIRRFPRLPDWEAGLAMPTLRQLEAYAAATHAPVGFFMLDTPPSEEVPIPDFRTRDRRPVQTPSANLLDTIYLCQARQDWYRDHLRAIREDPLPHVGSVGVGTAVVDTAAAIGAALGFDLDARRQAGTWEEALRLFIQQAEDAGILVMRSGIVGNNTHRPLDLDEFRGFTLADPFAPVVFVNGADTKSGQMFTLAHELVHVWSGETGLGDEDPRILDVTGTEAWCDAVAAELLVPAFAMRGAFDRTRPLEDEIRRLARRFKVSTLVILRRVLDIGGLTHIAFRRAYEAELQRLRALGDQGAGGGNFHFTEAARVSRRFARAIISSTLEGQTLYRDAFRMLAISKIETFRDFGQTIGVAV
jgi:Zn-dependent peptidase ImmA (M78 family)